jgi:FKBP-type peptidyl-prolyl cis-trans isomerase (trigger factor)
LLVAVAVVLFVLMALVACKLPSTGEVETGGSDTGAAESTSKTEKETETSLPRFDYLSEDLSEYISIDPSVYEEIKLTLAADLQITDAEIERYITSLRFGERTIEAESETMVDEPLEWGDNAYIYYTGYIDGVAFANGSNMSEKNPSELGLGSSDFIPGFEAGLVGVIPSQTSKENPVRINAKFPSWYSTSSVAGKEAVFEVYVVYAVEYKMPDYDVAFVRDDLLYEFKKDFYASDAARLAEFEEYVRDYMEKSMEETITGVTDEERKQYLLAAAEFIKLPELELSYYRATYLDEFEYYYDYYKSVGADVGEFADFVCKMMGLEKGSDWEAELTRGATESVRYDLLRFAVAKQEGLTELTNEEMDKEIKGWIDYYTENYGTTVTKEEIIENLGESYLRQSAISAKVYKYLADRTTTTYSAE